MKTMQLQDFTRFQAKQEYKIDDISSLAYRKTRTQDSRGPRTLENPGT